MDFESLKLKEKFSKMDKKNPKMFGITNKYVCEKSRFITFTKKKVMGFKS